MRRPSFIQFMLSGALCALVALTGCSSTPKADRNKPLHATPTQPDAQARADRAAQRDAAQMQDLLLRLQALETDNVQLQKKLSDQYMQAVALKKAQLEAAKKPSRPAPATATQPQANTGQTHTANTPQPADPRQLSRTELLNALIAKIVEGKDSDRVKALMAAAISVATDHKQMDPRLLDQLDPRAREQVARFHQMLAVTYEELAGDARATLTRQGIMKKIDEVFGAQPLEIERFKLCRRVDGYGVYEPFVTTRFLAGRKNRVLAYVELDNFKHEPLEDGRYEVRLEQSVELYDATGETTVWRQGPVQLVDISRNKRRDFFIVYPIDLPARLPAGGYRLKVRIADKHTGSLCEQTMHDIQIVADESLIKAK